MSCPSLALARSQPPGLSSAGSPIVAICGCLLLPGDTEAAEPLAPCSALSWGVLLLLL